MTRKLQEAFFVSAPGKTIVFGEHAVVHAKPAIAAAISLRSYLFTSPLNKSQHARTITLDFPDVGQHDTWNVDQLPWSSFQEAAKNRKDDEPINALDQNLLKSLQPSISAVSPNVPEPRRKIHQLAATAFLYLLMSLASPDTVAGHCYRLKSTIPIAAGLGSSASMSVCIATTFLCQSGRLGVPGEQESEAALQLINEWAFVGELCIHGNPSGIDNTVATRGKAVLFQRSLSGGDAKITPITDFPVLPLLLVDTKQERSTAAEVAKVGALREAHPAVVNRMLDTIGEITNSVYDVIQAEDFDVEDVASLQRLGELVRMNHGVLVSLGVSHPKLERIRELIDHAGIGWTKLTGAGGGGCAITILKPDVIPEALSKLEDQLSSEGFQKYETLLGGKGAGILNDGPSLALNEDTSLDEIDEFLDSNSDQWQHW